MWDEVSVLAELKQRVREDVEAVYRYPDSNAAGVVIGGMEYVVRNVPANELPTEAARLIARELISMT
jgi:hypothetical protein